MTVDYRTGDVLDQIRQLPDASVDLVATSPPFLALRDYNGQPGQWGSEPDPASFLDHLLELTTELRRVLAPHGSIAIELGDTFAGSGGPGGDYAEGGMREGQPRFDGSARAKRGGTTKNDRVRGEGHAAPIRNLNGKIGPGGVGWPGAKSLCGTPTLFAWSLAYGRNLLRPDHTIDPWLVRNVIVWARNNPPVGALGDKVRPATSYITVACPSPRRWFDLDAVRDGHAGPRRERSADPKAARGRAGGVNGFAADRTWEATGGAPPLDHWHDEPDGDLLWLINTQGSSLAHYAMWPPRLVERLILAMCPAEVCRTCGEPRRRLVANDYVPLENVAKNHAEPKAVADYAGQQRQQNAQGMANGRATKVTTTLGWSDCGHGGDYRPGHVLDTFAGSGTTLFTAEAHGRDATGIDLDPNNVELLPIRRAQVRRTLLREEPQIAGQMSLLGEGA